MTRRAQLPSGMTPRLLSREAAAAYCGISPNLFGDTIAEAVKPIEIRGRKVWDIRALDRWVDRQSCLFDPCDRGKSLAGRLNGDQGARS